jgi:xylulokinase
MVEATGLPQSAMPRLIEGSEASGELRHDLCRRWGMKPGVVIAGGAGDQAARAIGQGGVAPGQGFQALGTTGVFFVASEAYAPNPAGAVHTFCHALPGRWHQMSVVLSAASCLSWLVRTTHARDEATLVAEMQAEAPRPGDLIFLPYLSGERTPHNDPLARGVFFGLTHEHSRAHLTRAVLEGVAFALADGQRVLLEAGAEIGSVSVIGGGARNREWGRILASVLDRPLDYTSDADVGPAFGAARLARLASSGEDPSAICVPPPVDERIDPDRDLVDLYRDRYSTYRRLYDSLRGLYREAPNRPE